MAGILTTLLNKSLLWYYRLYGKLCPSEGDLLIFGARNGMYYMDNSRALYEWYLQNRPDQKVLWLTQSKRVLGELGEKNFPVASFYSHKGIRALHRARFGFYTNRALDLVAREDLLPQKLKLIFLSHGQSVKNSRLTVKEGLSESFKKDIIKTGSQVYRAITSSHWMAEIQHKSQGLDPGRYMITGFPRNDWMLDLPPFYKEAWQSFTGAEKFSKVILYAPTWRMHGEPTRLFPFDDLDVATLALFLDENKILLLLRPHIQELKAEINKATVAALLKATDKVRLATNDSFTDANALLPFTDMLLSDYSSIYHDYMLLDRPMAFIPYDYDKFERENGFKYPYKKNLPGHEVRTQKGLIEVMKALLQGKDLHAAQRDKLKGMVYAHSEGSACERVAKEIDKL